MCFDRCVSCTFQTIYDNLQRKETLLPTKSGEVSPLINWLLFITCGLFILHKLSCLP